MHTRATKPRRRNSRRPRLFEGIWWLVLVSVAGGIPAAAAESKEEVPERDLRFLSATYFSLPVEGPRLLTLWFYEEQVESPNDPAAVRLPTSRRDVIFGDTLLALLEGGLDEPTASEEVVWFGVTSVVWFGVTSAINIHTGRREAFDAEVVRIPSGRVFVIVMVGDWFSVKIEVYEVATGGEPRSFLKRLELHKRLWYSEDQAKPLTTYQMDVGGGEEDVCLRNRLQAVVEADAVLLAALRDGASCPPRWSRLDLQSLEWSAVTVERVPVEPISDTKDAGKHRD